VNNIRPREEMLAMFPLGILLLKKHWIMLMLYYIILCYILYSPCIHILNSWI